MKDLIKQYWELGPKYARVLFWTLLCIGVGFLIASWFVPPMGVIDNSILVAFGEVQSFAGIGFGLECVILGKHVKVSKGDTEIEINNSNS